MIPETIAHIPKKVLLLEAIDPLAQQAFEANGYQVESLQKSIPPEELIDRLQDGIEILGSRSKTKISSAIFDQGKNLEAVGAFCIGTNQIDKKSARESGVAVFNDPVSNGRSVAELAIGHIIELSRRGFEISSNMHNGNWDKSVYGAHEVRGKKLGIVGYGKIGLQLSDLAEKLGLEVLFYDLKKDTIRLGNAKRKDSLHELLEEADIVSVHVDDRPENTNLFGYGEFQKMKEGALFLNLSRGYVVDEDALADNLNSKHLAGAAIDVFQKEPRASGDKFQSPLQGIPNVILTSHVGGNTVEAQKDIAKYVSGKLIQFDKLGDTTGSVNIPNVSVTPRNGGTHRFSHIHRNEKGIIAAITDVLAENEFNIVAQELSTDSDIGYVIFDVNRDVGPVVDQINNTPHTIRTRILY